MTDPIADMLTRVRNANVAYKDQVDVPFSKIKEQIARVLKREGYVKDFQVINTGVQGVIRLFLKYVDHGPNRERVISGLRRISTPGLRVYVRKTEIPRIFGGLGVVILSTPRGVLTGKQAKKLDVGGEVLAYVW
ncbi:MAG: 30S ribosomal protein S8 [Proteobacteria bacterium]|nr:30S ribosomal protein S8 [Pseudomonadota bacterium]